MTPEEILAAARQLRLDALSECTAGNSMLALEKVLESSALFSDASLALYKDANGNSPQSAELFMNESVAAIIEKVQMGRRSTGSVVGKMVLCSACKAEAENVEDFDDVYAKIEK